MPYLYSDTSTATTTSTGYNWRGSCFQAKTAFTITNIVVKAPVTAEVLELWTISGSTLGTRLLTGTPAYDSTLGTYYLKCNIVTTVNQNYAILARAVTHYYKDTGAANSTSDWMAVQIGSGNYSNTNTPAAGDALFNNYYEIPVGLNEPVNTMPNAPINLSPSGSSEAPSRVKSFTPTLTWTFSDPDAGNAQSAFQVQIFNASGTLVHDSQTVSSANASYTVPSTAGLLPNTVYSWTVRTWDNATTSSVSTYATVQYIKTSQSPTATSLAPGNANSSTPDVCSTMPRLTWTYGDGDGDVQNSYQVKIYNASTTQLVYDSSQIVSASNFHAVPSGALGANIKLYWTITVWDSTGMSTTSNSAYILTNTPPATVTLFSPANTLRTNLRPIFVANIGDDAENDKQNFKLQLAYDMNFTSNLQEFSTVSAATGWEAYNGTSWVAFPSGGVDSTFEGKQVRYTYQSDLTEGKTYYWRMAPIDGTTGVVGTWSASRTIRVGDTLQFKLKTPMKTAGAAIKLLLTGKRQIATDGTTPASLKVEVCNNGLDASPTWEDATSAFLNGLYYRFTNTAKIATDWAVDARVTIKANDSLGAIEFDGFGFTIS